MAHGYLREFDEGWDRGERDRETDWRERSDWRDRDPVWRGDRETERGRGFMLSDDLRGRERRYGSSLDDHYRSWRDRQMRALDRDYADYCREREEQFHQDFDSWRQNRLRDHGQRGRWGTEQGSGPDEQTFTPQTTAVGNTMTTSETHEPQSTTTPEDVATQSGTRSRR